MAKPNFLEKVSSVARWLLYAVCFLIALKVLIVVVGFVTTSLAIASLGAWILGFLAVGAVIAFVGWKIIQSKRK
jgi:hypothetical protein